MREQRPHGLDGKRNCRICLQNVPERSARRLSWHLDHIVHTAANIGSRARGRLKENAGGRHLSLLELPAPALAHESSGQLLDQQRGSLADFADQIGRRHRRGALRMDLRVNHRIRAQRDRLQRGDVPVQRLENLIWNISLLHHANDEVLAYARRLSGVDASCHRCLCRGRDGGKDRRLRAALLRPCIPAETQSPIAVVLPGLFERRTGCRAIRGSFGW
mmetsp:Transcript_21745/g.49992  ORF Transcript_21745/g.49992 Transcript_21745/m.49992 type:complete len:218 (+) Transcript_21745:1164-1817(+)